MNFDLINNCVFCEIVQKKRPAYIIYEDSDFLAFLDIRPQSLGHTQLIPKKHYRWVYDILNIGEFFVCAQLLIHGIIHALDADHVQLATFGYEVKHAHLWIVPHFRDHIAIREGGGLRSSENSLNQVAEKVRHALKEVSK